MATITVLDPAGNALEAAYVRVYGNHSGVVVASGLTDASGHFTASPGAGDFFIHVEPDDTASLAPQFLGSQTAGNGVADLAHAGYWDGISDVTVRMLEDFYLSMDGNPIDRVVYLYWKDTTDSAILRLAAGEERTRCFQDVNDPIYLHALVGPFLSRAKAAAA
jgi:hypothetical protein